MNSTAAQYDAKEMREVYCQALIEAAHADDRIVALDCDMRTSMGTGPFAQAFPSRSFNLGIQEANACGVAAGLAATGFVPFLHTFSVFISRRIFDQVFLSCGYAGQNVKLVGGDAGVSTASNGGTHMPFEDIGLFRCIPGMTIVEPADAVAMAAIVPQLAAHVGLDYLRMQRRRARTVYDEGQSFQLGRANLLREGDDVTIISCGMLVGEALDAAKQLAARGVTARVVDMFIIKPLDVDCVLRSAERTGAVVTAENHNVIGGLGSAVADCLGKNHPVPIEMVGVEERFGEVGDVESLKTHFGLTADDIVQKALTCIVRKNSR